MYFTWFTIAQAHSTRHIIILKLIHHPRPLTNSKVFQLYCVHGSRSLLHRVEAVGVSNKIYRFAGILQAPSTGIVYVFPLGH